MLLLYHFLMDQVYIPGFWRLVYVDRKLTKSDFETCYVNARWKIFQKILKLFKNGKKLRSTTVFLAVLVSHVRLP